jgi:hypothetical protein
MRCLKHLFKGFLQPNVRPQVRHNHLCLLWRLFPLRFTLDDKQCGQHFLSHKTTQLLNVFNNYTHKMRTLNNLTMILAILFEHYTQNDKCLFLTIVTQSQREGFTLHFVLPFGPETSRLKEDSVSKERSHP